MQLRLFGQPENSLAADSADMFLQAAPVWSCALCRESALNAPAASFGRFQECLKELSPQSQWFHDGWNCVAMCAKWQDFPLQTQFSSACVCDKVVCERLCVTKFVRDKVCVWKSLCDKVVCERVCVTRLCVERLRAKGRRRSRRRRRRREREAGYRTKARTPHNNVGKYESHGAQQTPSNAVSNAVIAYDFIEAPLRPISLVCFHGLTYIEWCSNGAQVSL